MDNVIIILSINRVVFQTLNTVVFVENASDRFNSTVVCYDLITGEPVYGDDWEVYESDAKQFAFWLRHAAYCTSVQWCLEEAARGIFEAREIYPFSAWKIA